jgi:methylmalonyl-CoA mutase
MNTSLFDEFEPTSAKAWKQKIQVDLKGDDYNETLLWETKEGITVKPFYTKEDRKSHHITTPKNSFSICQSIFIDDEKIANSLALNALKRGATSIEFRADKTFNYKIVLQKIDASFTPIYFRFSFLASDLVNEIHDFYDSKNIFFDFDIIGNLAKTGNWFFNLKEDLQLFEKTANNVPNSIAVNADLYQNAGATIVEQLAFSLAHANEYLNQFESDLSEKFHFTFSVSSNYFFEIAKLRAFRILWKTLLKEYNYQNTEAHIFAKPSLRNKTLYDYNVNMLRTTTECMSAILGGSNTICNVPYDSFYHKSNEFGERISRNQLLILQQESGFDTSQNMASGSYYIESLTHQLAEKALKLFKKIEENGGFLSQLKKGAIQEKINKSAQEEQANFDTSKLVLVGTNFQQNSDDQMRESVALYPFLKQNNSKTLLVPILSKRLAETSEKERLKAEKG